MKKVILLLVGLFILLVSQVAASNYYDSRDSRYQYHFPNRDDGDRVYVTNNYYNYGGYGGQNSYSGGYYPVNYGPRYVAINYYDTYDYRFVDRSRYQRQVYAPRYRQYSNTRYYQPDRYRYYNSYRPYYNYNQYNYPYNNNQYNNQYRGAYGGNHFQYYPYNQYPYGWM